MVDSVDVSSLHPSPFINHQSSIINHQSSIINHQSSIINHHSPIATRGALRSSKTDFISGRGFLVKTWGVVKTRGLSLRFFHVLAFPLGSAESIEQLGSEERVYNLEIHGEQVFRVAFSGVPVHA